MITQLGMDPFGDKILEDFRRCGIGCEAVSRTEKANTSLAFRGTERRRKPGNFSFYRKPGADMLLEPSRILPDWFDDGFGLHFLLCVFRGLSHEGISPQSHLSGRKSRYADQF